MQNHNKSNNIVKKSHWCIIIYFSHKLYLTIETHIWQFNPNPGILLIFILRARLKCNNAATNIAVRRIIICVREVGAC